MRKHPFAQIAAPCESARAGSTPARWVGVAVLGLAAMALAPQPASAHYLHPSYDEGDAYVPEGVVPGLRQADGRACVKQCPFDDLPCDPPEYKRADGRCTFQR